MAIDTKRYEEYCEKRAEIEARSKVQRELGHFAFENIERCKKERNFTEMSAWLSVVENNTANLTKLNAEYGELINEYRGVV